MPDILHLIRIAAPPPLVYRALTTADGIRRWWTRDADLDEVRGGTGAFRFNGGKAVTRVTIDALEPPRRVAWRTISAHAPGGWEGTTIAFDLRAEGRGTALAFAHRGFSEESEGFAIVNTVWAHFLISLRQYLETGTGAPHPDVDFMRMLR
jgi:uncharacterized protein YndB with AHSA1/START domain